MPQELSNRLETVWDPSPWTRVDAERGHWPGGNFGTSIPDVRTIVVHETSGFASRKNGENMFFSQFFGGNAHQAHTGETSQAYVSGDGTVMLGLVFPLESFHANFINDWALGIETGHAWGNYKGNAHDGPYTSTVEPPKPPATLPAGVHVGDLKSPPTRKPGNNWLPLSGNDAIAVAADDDLPGLKFWVNYQGFGELVVALWTTGRYTGPWRQAQRVPEQLFNESQYRSWALLTRWLAEMFGVPRNFPLLPHKMRVSGYGTAGGLHGMTRDGASFRSIVLADEILSRSIGTFGFTAPQLAANNFPAVYRRHEVQHGVDPNEWFSNPKWTQVFDLYRGIHGHGFSGEPSENKDHDCPGPMFDWHRFAREVWDWWWHPFDFDATNTLDDVRPRVYSLPARDGNTPLTEHFFGTPSALHLARATRGIHDSADPAVAATSSPMTFELPATSRIYALANGELVAARFPAETGGVDLAFMVVRHEVFHELSPLAGQPAIGMFGMPLGPPGTVFPDRIDYDRPASTVYSLSMHLGRPQGMTFAAVDDANPDWLNRLLVRKKEADLGLQFTRSPAGQAVPADVWRSRPPGMPRRATVGEAWNDDHTLLEGALRSLREGRTAIFTPTLSATPVRIVLGDYLGNAGVIRHAANGTQHGIRIEIFSRDLVSPRDFMLTVSDDTRGWAPNQGTGEPAVRYPSEWSRDPHPAELANLRAAGVDLALVRWWRDFQQATAFDQRLPADARLEGDGTVVHYHPHSFMGWINTRTWRSEWPKYATTDPAGVPAAPRPR